MYYPYLVMGGSVVYGGHSMRILGIITENSHGIMHFEMYMLALVSTISSPHVAPASVFVSTWL